MRVLAVFFRVLRSFRRDKRTLALLMVAPVLVLSLLWVIFHSDAYDPKIAVVDLPPELAQSLEARGARLRDVDAATAERLLAANEIDAVVLMKGGKLTIRLEGSDPAVSRSVRMLFLKLMQDQAAKMQKVMAAFQSLSPGGGARANMPMEPPTWEHLHGGEGMSQFDNFGPVLLGFLVFFFTFIVSGVSFVRERTTGTLERMLASPIRSWELVAGYAMGFAVVVIAQATLASVVSVYVLGMLLTGSFGWLLVITLMLATTAMTLGMLLSAFARSEFQLFQFIPVVIVPQVFFSGIFQIEAMAPWLRAIGKVLPLTYGAHAMRQVMIRGGGFSDIYKDLLLLAACALVFLALNVVALDRKRAV